MGSPALLSAIMEQEMLLRSPMEAEARKEAERNLHHLILLHGALTARSEEAAQHLADLIRGHRNDPLNEKDLSELRAALDAIITEPPTLIRSHLYGHLDEVVRTICLLFPPNGHHFPLSVGRFSGVVKDIDYGIMVNKSIQNAFQEFPKTVIYHTLTNLKSLMFSDEEHLSEDDPRAYCLSPLDELLEDETLYYFLEDTEKMQSKGKGNALLNDMIHHLPAITLDQLHSLAALAEEYNLEWALASFDWME